jgi:protoporphyrinogen/coproporphyrinogen III oxidase
LINENQTIVYSNSQRMANQTTTTATTKKRTQPTRLLIIGGGITGLAAAWRARELDPTAEIHLWEERPRWGGVLYTEKADPFLIEHSADNFLIQEPWAMKFAAKTGCAHEMIPTNAGNRRASVLCRGELVEVPEGFMLMSPKAFWPMVTTPLLSWRGKLRLFTELFRESRPGEQRDESLASFAIRRFGQEAFDRLIQPLIGGIYTADPEKLSLAATLPRFLDQERQHGSLLRAALEEQAIARMKPPTIKTDDQSGSGARYHQFYAPRQGMSWWVNRIVEQLATKCVMQLERRVTGLYKWPDGTWRVTAQQLTHGTQVGEPCTVEFDQVLLTTPAPATARLVERFDSELAKELEQIEYAGSSVVVLAVRKEQLGVEPTGFGMVVPAVERRSIIAVSYSSEKFPGRAPSDLLVLRVFVGGALQPELANLPDEQLYDLVLAELRSIYRLTGVPLLQRIVRWNGAMPQYHLGHLDRVARIEALTNQHAGLALAGAAYRGVGIPQCIHSGELAAEKLLA